MNRYGEISQKLIKELTNNGKSVEQYFIKNESQVIVKSKAKQNRLETLVNGQDPFTDEQVIGISGETKKWLAQINAWFLGIEGK